MSPDFPPADDDDLLAAGRRALRELPDAPEWMILRAEALGAPRAAPAAAPSLLRRVQAALSVDSWAGAVPVLRGAAGTRQLLFSAAEYDVDLRIAPAEQAWSIAGQVLGPDDAAQVLLTGPDGVARPARPLDELGGFHIDGLAAGRYRLELQLADRVIELPPVDVGPDAAADG
ncbi:MAG: hypothetical protein KIS83_13365 [Rubrivivax sp.]|nr:hypothetical protein [Rubrivivax sp.]